MKQNVYFVSGIDTDAGKSYATGYLAREWNKNGKRTITQKFIQTGLAVESVLEARYINDMLGVYKLSMISMFLEMKLTKT